MRARATAARKPKKRKVAEDCDHDIYDGSISIGVVVGRAGVFKAKDRAGKLIGSFDSANSAMRAVTAAARGARAAS